MKKEKIRALCISAVMGAVGFVLMLIEFPMPFIIPAFVKFDFSELPSIIAAFSFGPVCGIFSCLIKNLLHLFVTTSAGVGELSNFVLGAIFSGVCGVFYKRNKTRKGAMISLAFGAFLMAAISVFTNYFLVYPAYVKIYGMPMDVIIGMYKALLPYSDTLLKSLLIFNLPFTFFKGIADAVICLLIYKRLSPILKYGKSKRA